MGERRFNGENSIIKAHFQAGKKINPGPFFKGKQARIQEFTLVGAPWIGEGSGQRRVGGPGGEAPQEAHEN